jgi:segregation and condensation protein B
MSEPPEGPEQRPAEAGATPTPAEDEFGATAPAEVPEEEAAAEGGPAEDEFGTAAPAEEQEAPPDPAVLAQAQRLAEALIFASDKPVTRARLQSVLPEGLPADVVLTALSATTAGRGVELVEVAGGFAFRTAPDLAPALTRVIEVPRRLPRAAMEALSIIAYHQPVTRGEIEEIRGASLSQTSLEALLEASLIAPRGRREAPGRPTLWGTTPQFLAQFGLKSLNDLPRREELVSAEAAAPLFSAPPEVAAEAEAEPEPEQDAGAEAPEEEKPEEDPEENPREQDPPA